VLEVATEMGEVNQRLQLAVTERQQVEEALSQARAQWAKQAEEYRTALAKAEQALQAELANRQQVEKALRGSEERFRIAAGSATDVIYEWDIESGRMEFFSDPHARLSDDPHDFPGTVEQFQQIIHPDDRQRVDAAIERHLRTRQPFSEEYRVLRKDGQVLHWKAFGTALWDENDKPCKWIGTATDITGLKQAEEEKQRLAAQVHQTQKMEAVAMLAGGVAQDFNELLTVILGNTELGLAQLEPSYPLYNELMTIQRTARRAVALTRQLLAFGRRQVLQPKALDLNLLITGFSKVLHSLIGEHVDLQLKLAPELKPVFADEGALEQVLMNLALNARDAMPEGGTLRIETAEVVLGEAYRRSHPEAQGGEYVRLTVTDSGVKGGKAVQEHLFEPFFVPKEPGKWSGLDLAVVYGIVKQHDGLIEVQSQEGGGTSVEIHLPVHTGEAGAGEAGKAAPPAPRPFDIDEFGRKVRQVLDRARRVTRGDL